eukprot:g11572.t1
MGSMHYWRVVSHLKTKRQAFLESRVQASCHMGGKKTYGNRPIKCVETGEVYPSLKQAAKAAGVHRVWIFDSIHFGWQAGGFHWAYASGQIPSLEEDGDQSPGSSLVDESTVEYRTLYQLELLIMESISLLSTVL